MTHLLVVDDEVSILELIKNSLGKDGYLITVCQNADDVDIKNAPHGKTITQRYIPEKRGLLPWDF